MFGFSDASRAVWVEPDGSRRIPGWVGAVECEGEKAEAIGGQAGSVASRGRVDER